MDAFQTQDEAYRAFERWCAEHDPDGELDICDAALAYSEWASTNSIAKYLDDLSGNVNRTVFTHNNLDAADVRAAAVFGSLHFHVRASQMKAGAESPRQHV